LILSLFATKHMQCEAYNVHIKDVNVGNGASIKICSLYSRHNM